MSKKCPRFRGTKEVTISNFRNPETGKEMDEGAWEGIMAGVFYKMELKGKDKK